MTRLRKILDLVLGRAHRQVIQHPDGSVELRGYSARAAIRWYRKQNWDPALGRNWDV